MKDVVQWVDILWWLEAKPNIDAFCRFCVMDTDLKYASKEDFQTDAQIAAAKQNGEVIKQKFRTIF